MSEMRPPMARPPLALGCLAAAGLAGLVVVMVILGVRYLESGSDDGNLPLDAAESYAKPSVTRSGEDGLWVVRTDKGEFFALADMDAANRLAAGRKCKVNPIGASDPALAELLSRYRGSISAPAANIGLLFREDCNGAVYDAAGVRQDGEGPNLDRFATSVDSEGRLVVKTAKRSCTTRDGNESFAKTEC